MPWRRKQQPTPIFLPGKSHRQRSLAGCTSWGHKTVGHDLATKQQPQMLLHIHKQPCMLLWGICCQTLTGLRVRMAPIKQNFCIHPGATVQTQKQVESGLLWENIRKRGSSAPVHLTLGIFRPSQIASQKSASVVPCSCPCLFPLSFSFLFFGGEAQPFSE